MHLLRQVITTHRRIAVHLAKHVRTFALTTNVQQTISAAVETPFTIPAPEGIDAPANPKLLSIVNDIAKLNLLEVSELSALLKKTLNLPDAPVVAYGAGGGAAASAASEEDEEAAAPKIIQTAFKVKMCSFDDSKKIALIKELKNQTEGMNLVQAKKFIESIPALLREDISRDEADKLKEALEKVGAVVEIL